MIDTHSLIFEYTLFHSCDVIMSVVVVELIVLWLVVAARVHWHIHLLVLSLLHVQWELLVESSGGIGHWLRWSRLKSSVLILGFKDLRDV